MSGSTRHRKLLALPLAAAVGAGLVLSASGSAARRGFIKAEDMNAVTKEETGALLNENYYAYINFDRLKSETIPYGEYQSPLSEDWTEPALIEIVYGLLESGGDLPAGSNERKIYDFCEQLRDEEARENAGTEALEGILSAIEAAENIDELIKVSAELMWDYGTASLFDLSVKPGFFDSSRYTLIHTQMALPIKVDDYLADYKISENLQRTIRGVLTLRGSENPAADARLATDLLIEIMENSITYKDIFYAVERYEEMTLDELGKMFEADITPFTERAAACGADKITVCDVGQLRTMAGLLTNDNLSAWKAYLLMQTLHRYQDVLPKAAADVFYPLGEKYKKPTEQVLLTSLNGHFLDEVSFLFTERYADAELIESARGFARQIISAYAEMIRSADGIDDLAKAGFIRKLENMEVNICVPDRPYDGNYSWTPSESGGELLKNMIGKNSGEFNMQLGNLGKPFDKTIFSWGTMPPYTYGNAQYKLANYVLIPYASLTEPYYDPDRDFYENLGYLGFIIAHEISHGFDSLGICFDDKGTLAPDWVGEEYAERLARKKADITELFGAQKLFGIYPLDGAATLGENMADIAAVQCILSMAKTAEQKQTVLESYARGWFRLAYDSEVYDQIYSDEHAPSEFRTNVVVSQMDDFYEVYGITDGGMYTPPADRKRVW